jgi:hypothetical protein
MTHPQSSTACSRSWHVADRCNTFVHGTMFWRQRVALSTPDTVLLRLNRVTHANVLLCHKLIIRSQFKKTYFIILHHWKHLNSDTQQVTSVNFKRYVLWQRDLHRSINVKVAKESIKGTEDYKDVNYINSFISSALLKNVPKIQFTKECRGAWK